MTDTDHYFISRAEQQQLTELLDSVQRGLRPDSHAEPYTRGMAQGIFVLAQRIRINLPDHRREERNR